eukprot:4873757-Alexandrium_andersonii.AAC.1
MVAPDAAPALPSAPSLHAATLALQDLGAEGATEASRLLALWLTRHVSEHDPLAPPLWPAAILAWAMETA